MQLFASWLNEAFQTINKEKEGAPEFSLFFYVLNGLLVYFGYNLALKHH